MSVSAARPRIGGSRPDRGLYLPAAIGIAVLVVVGFGPSYFYRPFITPAASLTLLVQAHGALMSAWIALFVLQATVVSLGRVDLHRRIGRFAVVLLLLIVAISLPMTLIATRLGGDHMPGPALSGLALVLAVLFEFVTFAALGLYYRGRGDVHKRLMLLAAITAMEAGVSRLPIGFLDSTLRVHLANDSLLFILILLDWIKHRHLHPTLVWGAAFLLAVQSLSLWVSGTETWLRMARAIVNAAF